MHNWSELNKIHFGIKTTAYSAPREKRCISFHFVFIVFPLCTHTAGREIWAKTKKMANAECRIELLSIQDRLGTLHSHTISQKHRANKVNEQHMKEKKWIGKKWCRHWFRSRSVVCTWSSSFNCMRFMHLPTVQCTETSTYNHTRD